MPKARPQRRPGRALPQLILLLSSSSFACAKSTYENQGRIISNLSLAHHYFFHEIDFLAMQAMILGNYHGDADNATSSSKREEKIHRLRFLEKSLIVELDYVLRLEKIALDPDEILYNAASTESCSDETTECGSDEIRFRRDTPGEMITNTISGASWTSLVTTSKSESSVTTSKSEFSYKVDHEYDYGRAMKRGFALMYDDFDCGDHARDQNNQNKPIYTPEMWRKLWEIYRDSTSFPYPIPKAHECPEEPFYEAHTTDGKGRGIFASRNITKGSLVHTGHPNTVFFLDAKSWHRFVSSLPKMFACGKCPAFVRASELLSDSHPHLFCPMKILWSGCGNRM